MALITERTDLDHIANDLDIMNSIQASGQIISPTNNILNTLNNLQNGITTNNNRPFNKSFNITRPNDTTAYTVNKLLNVSKSATALPSLDCDIANAGKTINITSLVWVESNEVNQYPNQINLFDIPTIASMSANDNTSNAISVADFNAHHLAWLPAISSSASTENNFYTFGLFNVNKSFVVPASGLIYLAIWSNAVAVPVALESFQLNITGIIL